MVENRPPLAMRPEGFAGRVFGVLMEAINAPAYRFALDLLEVGPRDDVLEIGFGTGRMVELLLARTAGLVAGVDPAATMVEVAKARRRVRAAGARVHLMRGDDGSLDWPDAGFDRIAALHSFQFWPDPARTAARLNALLRPGGRAVLILRLMPRGRGAGSPNPLSRGPDEAQAALALMRNSGFETRLETRGRMTGLVGVKPRD